MTNPNPLPRKYTHLGDLRKLCDRHGDGCKLAIQGAEEEPLRIGRVYYNPSTRTLSLEVWDAEDEGTE